MRPLLLTLLFAVAAVCVTPVASVLACGIVLPPIVSESAAIDAQRALFVWRGIALDMHLQLSARSSSGGLAWILPVPGTPEVADGDNALFDALDGMTTPSVSLPRPSTGGLCGGDTGLPTDIDSATHYGGGTTGTYTFDVLGGSAAAVASWLDRNDYATPDDLEAALIPYADRGLRFLAVKVTDAASATLLPPLKVTVASPGDRRLTYPLGLSATTSAAVTPIVWYVLADKRFRVANAASTDVALVGETLRARLEAGESTRYDAAVDQLTEEAGGRLVVTEFAQDIGEVAGLPAVVAAELGDEVFYLTRLYARVPSAALADVIITFSNEAPDVSPTVIASRRGQQLAGTGLLLLLALLSGQWLTRRHSV